MDNSQHGQIPDPGAASMDAALTAYQQYRLEAKLVYLTEAIDFLESCITVTSPQHPEMLMRLNNLLVMLKERHEANIVTSLADIARAVEVTELAVSLSSDLSVDDSERRSWLGELGSLKWMLFKLNSDARLLNDAINSLTDLTQNSMQSEPTLSGRLTNLSLAYSTRYRLNTSREDVDMAVDLAKHAVNLMAKVDPGYPVGSSNLATIIMIRFEAYGDGDDLDKAVFAMRSAIDNAKKDDPHRFKYLSNLLSMLSQRYQRAGRDDDLVEAEKHICALIPQLPANSPSSAALLSAWATMQGCKYERTGDISWLESTIEKRRQILRILSPESPSMSGAKNNLAIALLACYTSTGRKGDLDQAITILRDLAASVSSHHVEMPTILFNLTNGLDIKYEFTGEMRLLDESIERAKQLIRMAAERNQQQPGREAALAEKLINRHRRHRDEQDVVEAIRLLNNELELYPSSPKRANWLADLAIAIEAYDQDPNSGNDWDKTIALLENETQLSINQPLHLPQRLITLANRLSLRYLKTKNMTQLNKAIEFGERASELTTEDSPQLATVKNNLGYAFELRHEKSKGEQDLASAITCFVDAWHSESSIPFHRIKAAGRGIRLIGLSGDFQRGAELAKEVMDFLPMLSAGMQDFNDRIYTISTYSGIVANTCTLLLSQERTIEALEYLQRGRAVVLRELQDSRALSLLREHDELLAERFIDLRNEIQAPLKCINSPVVLAQAVERRTNATRELQSIVENDIRGIPKLSRFQLGQSVNDMQQNAREGPLIVVNISDLRSDAIIITYSEVRALHLPLLKAEKLRSLLADQWNGSRATLGSGNKWCTSFLLWLWNNGVDKIIAEIEGIAGATNEPLPRVRWIGSGLGTSIPFHASGDHRPGSTNVMSRVISSYLLSTQLSSYNRADLKKNNLTSPERAVIATMRHTPGNYPDLQSAEEEGKLVADILKNRVTTKDLEQPPNRKHVLERIQECTVAHMACHGYVDPLDPARNGLVFARTGEDGVLEQDILTLSELARLDLQEAKLAYLSACSTAENKLAELADEFLTVVSGFQIAGFRHVVGALWASFDHVCKDVSESFYKSILGDSGIQWSNQNIAGALHKAVLEIRARYPKQPLLWAQFVHFGY